jgi:sugar phosphate isomerase/epimerase
MTGLVMQLTPRERVWLDPSRIGILYAELGGAEVQALLDRAMVELGTVQRELAAQYAARDLEGFARNLRRVRRIAEHLGLTTLATVAGDVGRCLDAGDATALAATWARLARSARQALAGGWDSTA